MRTRSLMMGMLAVLGLSAARAVGVESPSQHRFNLLGEQVGVAGYDPVSYCPEGGARPQRGIFKITAEYQGVTYRFASEEHRAAFQKNPDRYLPQYGGWCAWAVGAIGKRIDVDPESYDVREGKLYLFYRDPQLDARDLWLKEPAELARKADAKWPELAQ